MPRTRGVLMLCVIGAAVIGTMGAQGGCGSTGSSSGTSSGISKMSCDDLATAAEKVSHDSKSNQAELLTVRSLTLVTDNQGDPPTPTGSGEATLLECSGDGVFSDDTTVPVVLDRTIDARGNTFIEYKQQ